MDSIISILVTIFIVLLIFFIIKELWWFFVGIIIIAIVAYYAKLTFETIKNKKENEKINYTPEMGEVYKVCPFCSTKVKVSETTCPNCKHALN
jgi:hypothetical protein